jgi:hypothetical protein
MPQSPQTVARLASRLGEFRETLSPEELQNWQLMLSAMVGDMAEEWRPPSKEPERQTFHLMVKAIGEIYPGGAVRVETPPLIRNHFDDLRKEAAAHRPTALRHRSSSVGDTGPLAARLNNDAELRDFLARLVGVPLIAGRSSHYFYYDTPGDYLMPHADPINSSGVIYLVNLEHDVAAGGHRLSGSALRVYQPDGRFVRFPMKPGEGVVMLGGGTVHAREVVQNGERVVNMSLGYGYASELPSSLSLPRTEDFNALLDMDRVMTAGPPMSPMETGDA